MDFQGGAPSAKLKKLSKAIKLNDISTIAKRSGSSPQNFDRIDIPQC